MFKKIRCYLYYQKILVFAWNLVEYNKSFQAKIPVLVGHGSLEEAKELHMNQEMDLKIYQWELLKEKIENGTWKYIVAKFRKKIIGYAFYSTKEMSFAGTKIIECDLPKHAYYIFRLFVHPSFRNLSIGKHLIDFIRKILKKDGFTIHFSAVNSTNKIQLHNQKKGGSTIIGSVTFIKTKFFNKVFISKGIYKAGLQIRKTYS